MLSVSQPGAVPEAIILLFSRSCGYHAWFFQKK
jgi:hypothetical protein